MDKIIIVTRLQTVRTKAVDKVCVSREATRVGMRLPTVAMTANMNVYFWLLKRFKKHVWKQTSTPTFFVLPDVLSFVKMKSFKLTAGTELCNHETRFRSVIVCNTATSSCSDY